MILELTETDGTRRLINWNNVNSIADKGKSGCRVSFCSSAYIEVMETYGEIRSRLFGRVGFADPLPAEELISR